jgi:hydroxymethylglutaryl-CoA reductase
MSIRVQETASNCCEGVKNFASSAAAWAGRTVTMISSSVRETISKVAEMVKPHFENLRVFIENNKGSIVISAVACLIGAALTAIFTNICCKRSDTGNQVVPTSPPAPPASRTPPAQPTIPSSRPTV